MPPHRYGQANRGLPGASVGLRRPQLVIICIGRRIRLIVAMSRVSSVSGGSAVPVPETALSWNGCIPHVVLSEAWWVCTVSRIRKATKNQIKTEKGRFLQCRRGCLQLARRESWDFSCTGMPALRRFWIQAPGTQMPGLHGCTRRSGHASTLVRSVGVAAVRAWLCQPPRWSAVESTRCAPSWRPSGSFVVLAHAHAVGHVFTRVRLVLKSTGTLARQMRTDRHVHPARRASRANSALSIVCCPS